MVCEVFFLAVMLFEACSWICPLFRCDRNDIQLSGRRVSGIFDYCNLFFNGIYIILQMLKVNDLTGLR